MELNGKEGSYGLLNIWQLAKTLFSWVVADDIFLRYITHLHAYDKHGGKKCQKSLLLDMKDVVGVARNSVIELLGTPILLAWLYEIACFLHKLVWWTLANLFSLNLLLCHSLYFITILKQSENAVLASDSALFLVLPWPWLGWIYPV